MEFSRTDSKYQLEFINIKIGQNNSTIIKKLLKIIGTVTQTMTFTLSCFLIHFTACLEFQITCPCVFEKNVYLSLEFV